MNIKNNADLEKIRLTLASNLTALAKSQRKS